jgi:hypothetical protein
VYGQNKPAHGHVKKRDAIRIGKSLPPTASLRNCGFRPEIRSDISSPEVSCTLQIPIQVSVELLMTDSRVRSRQRKFVVSPSDLLDRPLNFTRTSVYANLTDAGSESWNLNAFDKLQKE